MPNQNKAGGSKRKESEESDGSNESANPPAKKGPPQNKGGTGMKPANNGQGQGRVQGQGVNQARRTQSDSQLNRNNKNQNQNQRTTNRTNKPWFGSPYDPRTDGLLVIELRGDNDLMAPLGPNRVRTFAPDQHAIDIVGVYDAPRRPVYRRPQPQLVEVVEVVPVVPVVQVPVVSRVTYPVYQSWSEPVYGSYIFDDAGYYY